MEEAHNKVAKTKSAASMPYKPPSSVKALTPKTSTKIPHHPHRKKPPTPPPPQPPTARRERREISIKQRTKKVVTPDNSESSSRAARQKPRSRKILTEGRKDIQEYREEMLSIEIDATEKQMALFVTAEQKKMDKYKALGEKLIQLKQKQAEEQQAWSLRDLERQQSQEEELLESRYARGLVSEEAYNLQRNAITLKISQKAR